MGGERKSRNDQKSAPVTRNQLPQGLLTFTSFVFVMVFSHTNNVLTLLLW